MPCLFIIIIITFRNYVKVYLLHSLTDVTSLISMRLWKSLARQLMFSMGQSGALVVVGLAVVVVVIVCPDPPPPIGGRHASDWRTAAIAIKMVSLCMTLALQKCQLIVPFAFKFCLFIQKKIKDKCVILI